MRHHLVDRLLLVGAIAFSAGAGAPTADAAGTASGATATSSDQYVSTSQPAETATPNWAKLYTDGLKAWRDIIYYWLDRQHPDGNFGFGWGEDEEMNVGWHGVMMAADDHRIQKALERLADARWFNPNIQRGYVSKATDAEHGAEAISYTIPPLLYQMYGSPRIVERLMVTSQNAEYWTGLTPRGDRHMRSTYFGSQQMYEWPFYDEDCPINARAWLPMIHLVLYNRDPHLMKYFLEWADAWAKRAMEDTCGKPPGILPGQVVFATGEPGGYTKNWWGAGAHDFSSLWYQTRMNEVLVVAYVVTGEDKYIRPLREMLRFFSSHARPRFKPGEPPPPDRLPPQYQFPEGLRDGTVSTQWARDIARGHFGNWYYYVTGDTQFDEAFSRLLDEKIERGPFDRIDMEIVEAGYRRATSFRDNYFEQVVPKLKYLGSVANYAAAWWQKQYGTMTFGQRCFRDGGRLANNVNWPWVDFPPPAVVWKQTGYDTAIFVLEDSPQRLRVALCNVAGTSRRIGAQLFTLDEGVYNIALGPDADENGRMDKSAHVGQVHVERGSTVWFDLPSNETMLLELSRRADSGPIPPWRPRPDLGLDPWDLLISREKPAPGERVTVRVRVHNIGTQPAVGVIVLLKGMTGDGEVTLGTAILQELPAPQRLIPSFADVPIEWTTDPEIEQIGATIDPHDAIDELCESNNTAWISVADMKTSQPEKKHIPGTPATKPSLADVKTENLSRYDVPFRSGIRVDGVIGGDEWRDVPLFELIPHKKEPVRKRTWMRAAYDDRALYLAMRCEEPDLHLLKTDLPRIDDIYYNDGFEVFLDPGAQVWRYWQFAFDTAGHQFQTLSRNRYARQAEWQVAIVKGDNEWSTEVRFPFSEFDVKPAEPGDRWRMNVMRYTTTLRDPADPKARPAERSHFSPRGELHMHHHPELFGDLYFLHR